MRVDTREALTADTDYITGMKARAESRDLDIVQKVELTRKTLDVLTDGGIKSLATASDEDKQNVRNALRSIAEDKVGIEPEAVSCLYEPETLLSVESVKQPTDVASDIATFFKTPLGQRFMTLRIEDRQKMITQVGVDFD